MMICLFHLLFIYYDDMLILSSLLQARPFHIFGYGSPVIIFASVRSIFLLVLLSDHLHLFYKALHIIAVEYLIS